MTKSRVTVIDIARAAGVSKSSVSLVLQGSPLVSKSTRDRVNAAIRELGYVYNRAAANLRQSRSGIVGVVVNDLTNSFFAELAVGFDRVMQEAGYVQFLAHTGESLARQREVIGSMREYGMAGLVISPARGTPPEDLRALALAGIPVVSAVRTVEGARVSSLATDNHGGAREAVAHLARLGHRRIAFLGGYFDTTVYADRLGGYTDALAEAGLLLRPDLIIATAPSRAGGVEAVARALTLAEPPTAVLCFNDAVAFGACDGLRAHGLTPGRDVAVVGFDDVIEARSAVPALTTVAVDPQGMGSRAAHLLLKHINAGHMEAEAQVSPVRLAIRESCGASLLTPVGRE